MCRVLLEKIEIHQRTSTPGNWKKPINPQNIQKVLEYLGKLIRVCEGLHFGVTNLNQLMNFLTMQLIEECQRLSAIINISLKPIADQYPIEANTYAQFFERIAKITNQNSQNFQPSKQEDRRIHSQTSKSPLLHVSPGRQRPQPQNNQQNFPNPQQMNLAIPGNSIPIFPSPNTYFQNQKQSIIEKRWQIKPDELKLDKILGAGASCTVYKGVFKRTPVAVKMIKGGLPMGQSLEKEFEREVSAMMLLRHPNLILFMGACAEPQMIIVSEYCAGETVFKLLHERKNVMLS